MNTLVIVSHPNLEKSVVQNFLKASFPVDEDVQWKYLSETMQFDKKAEQAELLKNDRIIFQFPLYWYSAPATLKRWIDEVLDGDFAFSGKSVLEGKELGLVVSTGISEKQFQAGGQEKFTLSEVLRPFEMLANKLKMKYLKPFIISQFEYKTENQKMEVLINYQQYLQLDKFDFLSKIDWFVSQSNERGLDEFTKILGLKKNELENLNWQVRLLRESDGEG